MARYILNKSIFLAILLTINIAHGEEESDLDEHSKKTATAPSPSASKGQNYVYQTPFFGHGGYGGFGGFGGAGGYGNFGHIHPVPVTGVKALSVAYDPVSGVPYVCDPNKKDKAAGGAPAGGAAPAGGGAAPGAPAGKKSEIKKDEIKVKVPDYPPCPDPKKSFPWSCLLGNKRSDKPECVRAAKAVSDASKRWPFGGYAGYGGFGGFYPFYPAAYPVGWGAPFGLYGGRYFG